MIDLYYWPTPNGFKISIMLEELGLAYRVFPVDIGKGAQFEPAFLKISPNNKMPAIVDHDSEDGAPLALFESGAILLYLARKTGKLYASNFREQAEIDQWLFWQVGGFGPMLGQAHHFRHYAPEKVEYGINRYTQEATRLYNVLNKRLEDRPWVAGERYSIADIAMAPWARSWEKQGQKIEQLPHVARWLEAFLAREAVQRGLAVQV